MSNLMFLDKGSFIREMEKIQERWPHSKFTSRMIDLIYMELKKLSFEQLTRVIDSIIASERQAPLVRTFYEHAKGYISLNDERKKSESNKRSGKFFDNEQIKTITSALHRGLNENNMKPFDFIIGRLAHTNSAKCKECNDSGFVFTKHKENIDGADYVFNCTCANSEKNPNFPTWGANYTDNHINKLKEAI